MADYLAWNRTAWNSQVRLGNRWTVAVDETVIARARTGQWSIVVTPGKPVPRQWLGDVQSKSVLCLAGGGGQQAPVLAAAGADVTTLDNSELQLKRDRQVAERDGLSVKTVRGDMADLGAFEPAAFDLIVNPCSNCFVPDLKPVWYEAFRVLKPGGRLISGWINPLRFVFDDNELEQGRLVVRHAIPYSDLTSIREDQRQELVVKDEPFVFGHSLEDQIGGQLEAGFCLTGLFEDDWGEPDVLSKYINSMVATCAVKPVDDPPAYQS